MKYLGWFILLLMAAAPAAAEQWVVRADMWGVSAYYTLNVKRAGEAWTGDLDGGAIRGRLDGDRVSFSVLSGHDNGAVFTGRVIDARMEGFATFPDRNGGDGATTKHRFSAWLVPERAPGGPHTHRYEPGDFSHGWDADRAPVMVIWPGDTVVTETIDSGGLGKHGETRSLFGNPQTGPFFIAGAEPGDTLVIRLISLIPNRDYADSLAEIVNRARSTGIERNSDQLGQPVRWTIDRDAGLARPTNASGALDRLEIPLRPMLGGLGVAPGFGWPALSTGDTGHYGGNMDFSEVVAGNTIYLPGQRPGALLYLGDAHAVQGDGETTQFALETSMDVMFSVALIKQSSLPVPRIESRDEIMVLGQAGTMEDALKIATGGMVAWLRTDYGLTLSQAAQLMGVGIEYRIANLAGRNVGIAAKIKKALLPPSRLKLSVGTTVSAPE